VAPASVVTPAFAIAIARDDVGTTDIVAHDPADNGTYRPSHCGTDTGPDAGTLQPPGLGHHWCGGQGYHDYSSLEDSVHCEPLCSDKSCSVNASIGSEVPFMSKSPTPSMPERPLDGQGRLQYHEPAAQPVLVTARLILQNCVA
jgi:hypothetical protein